MNLFGQFKNETECIQNEITYLSTGLIPNDINLDILLSFFETMADNLQQKQVWQLL